MKKRASFDHFRARLPKLAIRLSVREELYPWPFGLPPKRKRPREDEGLQSTLNCISNVRPLRDNPFKMPRCSGRLIPRWPKNEHLSLSPIIDNRYQVHSYNASSPKNSPAWVGPPNNSPTGLPNSPSPPVFKLILKKIGRRAFFRLRYALMADPFFRPIRYLLDDLKIQYSLTIQFSPKENSMCH